METREQYPITLVTAYFELGGKPGCSGRENPYPRWIRNFLPLVRWPLVIFCDEQSLDMLREARGNKPAVYHVTRLEEFYAYRYLDDLKRLQFPDGEDAELYIARGLIWHEKHHFLRQVLSQNPYHSEMLFWCDIGQFRYDPDGPWWGKGLSGRISFRLFEDMEWPSPEVCSAWPQDKVILVNWCSVHILAQFFGGAVVPASRWCDAYYRRLEERKQNGIFDYQEEFTMVSCWKRWPELVHLMPGCFIPWRRNWDRLGCKRYVMDCTRFPWTHFRLGYKWHFLNGRRFPWKYFCRIIFSGLVR